jgi:hypothetical protein
MKLLKLKSHSTPDILAQVMAKIFARETDSVR